MSTPTPSAQTPVVDKQGRPMPVWARFFASLGSGASPQPAQTLTVSASPFVVAAAAPGALAITGGTVTALSLTRAQVTVTLPTGTALVPLGRGDQVSVTFKAAAAPTITFLPS